MGLAYISLFEQVDIPEIQNYNFKVEILALQGQKVGVIGGSQGLGSWLVGHLKEKKIEVKFTSADEYSELPSNKELLEFADVVFLCVPISAMETVMEEVYPYLQGKTLIEICSVKKFVIEKYESLKQQYPDIETAFCSIHPMFGPRIHSLTGQVILFNHSDRIAEGIVEELKEFFLEDHAQVYNLPYLRHDKLMGVVQGLNHFNVFVSAKTLARFESEFEDIKQVASPPYRIFIIFFTRYVLQNPRLYAEIQMNNEFVFEVVRIFRDEMNRLFDLIQTRDKEGFIKYIEDMQPYFASNKSDMEVSTHLIEQLGEYLEKKN
ncbi:prephenate dehydrogenase/arogenate dehydrogenase family protein [Limibacter armeniacum]|uniref:prephenate dehydrogenase/arogenate dehydrogenase family protein n=1 Tax=Limibacter armeniacum TaxID=466084 RepID=UPI002FE5BEB2